MLLFDRRLFLGAALALAGCGYTPVYGPESAANLRFQVLVQAPKNRDEFELVRAFETRLGRAETIRYTLEHKLNVTEETVVLSANSVQARWNVVGLLDYALKDANGAMVASGQAKEFTSYSSTGSTLSTDQSQRSARDRLMVLLADQTITRLVADLSR